MASIAVHFCFSISSLPLSFPLAPGISVLPHQTGQKATGKANAVEAKS